MFAELVVLESGKRCVLYSLRTGNTDQLSEKTMFEKFADEFDTDQHKDDFEALMGLLDQIVGRGAKRHYFRDEDFAVALPNIKGNSLRLYAIRFGEGALVLLSGAAKTSQKAQEGDTKSAFDEAQEIGRALDEMRRDGILSAKTLEDEQAAGLKFEY